MFELLHGTHAHCYCTATMFPVIGRDGLLMDDGPLNPCLRDTLLLHVGRRQSAADPAVTEFESSRASHVPSAVDCRVSKWTWKWKWKTINCDRCRRRASSSTLFSTVHSHYSLPFSSLYHNRLIACSTTIASATLSAPSFANLCPVTVLAPHRASSTAVRRPTTAALNVVQRLARRLSSASILH